MNINVRLDVLDIAERISRKELLELIKTVDNYEADWNFTFDILMIVLKVIKSGLKEDDIGDMLKRYEKKYKFKLKFDN